MRFPWWFLTKPLDSVLVQEKNASIVTPVMNFSLRAIALLALLGAASLLRAQDKGGSDPFSVDDPAAKPAAPAGEGVSPAPPPADEPALPDILPASPPKPAESKPAEAKPDGPPPSAPKPPEAAAPPAGGNLVPNSNFDKKNEKGEPRDWAFRHFHGKEAADSAGVVPEGREKDPCLKVSFTEPTSSSFATKVRLKPDTDYVFGGWIKTDGVSPEGKETLGAMIQIGSLADPSHKFSSDFLFGTHDWMEVKGKLHTGDSPQEYLLLCLLGGEGESKGTAWFDSVYLRENRIPYRRPALERSVFNREGVSLDKDQAAELATALGSLVCNFPEQGAVQKLDFKSCALGVALTLDPRNRIAVVVNSQLEEGRTPRSTDAFTDFSSLCRFFDELSSFLLGKDTTPDDRALGLYLADILWQIAPSSASGAQYAKLRDSGRGADWSPILPPPPKPAETETGGKEPEVAGHPNKGSEGTPANPDGTGPRIEPGPDYPGPAAKLAVGSAFARPNATFRTVVLAGGPGTRAALRAINLSWRDYKVEQHYSDKEGRNVDTRVPLESKGRAEAVFRDHMGSVIRDIWSPR